MAPSRRRGSQRAAAAAARRQWNVGDLVLAKMKGFPAWPAVVTEPEKWGYSSSDRKKLLVYFYGTKQIAFCNYADIEAFTEEKKKYLLVKRQGKGSDFVRAVEEIIDIYETTKKQSLVEANLRDEGMESNSANSEGSRSKSLRKSPEISSRVTDNNQSEALFVSTESHDVIADEPQVVSGDRQTTSAISSDPTEKVSILDELRQTPLSATTTRKRLRDGSLLRSVRQRVPSLRRSRSSSGGDSYKLQKSTMTLSDADLSSRDLVPDLMEEETADKNKLAEVVGHVSEGCNGVADASDGLTINGCSRDNVSDIADVESEKEGGMVESSCKLENSVDRYSNPGFNGGGRLNDKLDIPIKAVILKKKRGSHRKRVTTTRESDTLDTAAVSIELHESRSVSPITHKERNEKFCKADGDEHLPLVKRARVRMEKPSLEEKLLEDFVGDREKLEIETPVDDFDKCPTYSCPVNCAPGSRTTRIKNVTSSLPTNGCTLNEGTDPVLWKVNKYQLKGITVDVEAALPPSKRLHRALEAMSANAAESTVDIPEVAGDVELVSNGCTELPKSNSVHLLAAENILSSATLPHIQSCDNTNLQNNESGLPSSFTSDNLEVSMLASSLVEHNSALPRSLSSSHDKDCKEMLAGVRDCSGSFTSEIADTDIHEKVLHPCTFKLIEKEMGSTFTEGLHCQLSSPFGGKDGNMTLKPAKEPSFPRGDTVGENGMVMEPLVKLDCILNSKENGDLLPTDGTALASFSGYVGPIASKSSESTKSPGSLSDESIQSKDMQDDVKQAKHKAAMKYWGISSDTAPMKDLIAAAQAKRLLSRSTSFPDNVADGKVGFDDAVSPSVGNKEDSSVRGSPPSTGMYHRPASDDRTHQLHNDSRSPLVGQRQKGLNKLTLQGEANVVRRSFEALLCTLSRTKESIGRATRVAIDCAKYGIAAEAIEILLQYLERESSMYKKIDLFFLVDSITQWSRSQKGGAGDVYLSLVQSVLPRLLSAAAPLGHGAWENRKQCLKVLRLWLERKTLPESVVRHNIRELESVSEASLSSSYSRRPPRTERALNDPIREMEGMFVDEYGSNTNFQLQNFFNPRVLEDEEGSGDDEKSFEAVTPEQDNEIGGEKDITHNFVEKHRHILEDVDGELEMEDVAPQCGIEVGSLSHITGAEAATTNHCQLEQHEPLPCAPPLPEELPPSPPPLPSSPPPKPPHCNNMHTVVPQKQATSHAHSDVTDFHCSGIANSFQSQQHSVGQQSNNLHGNIMSSETVPYYNNGYGSLTKQMPPPLLSQGSSGSYASHPAMHSGNNVQPALYTPLPNKAYCLQPPPATVSNQFSYVQTESQQRAQPWCSSSYSDRYQYGHDSQGGNFLGDRSFRESFRHDNSERDRFSPAVKTGSVLHEKPETPSNSLPLYGSPSEPSANLRHGLSIPHRSSSYYVSSSQPPLENPISRVTGAHGYWRPR